MSLISIIIPAYNVAPWIEAALQSVLGQTLPDWECLVIDDGSTDDTAAGVSRFADERIHLVHQANGGVSAARNTGLELARGNLIAFLDADDLWQPQALERLSAPLVANERYLLSWADFVRFDDATRKEMPLPGTRLWHTGDAWADLLVDNFMHIGAVCVRAEQVKQFRFNTALRVGEDRDWLLRVLKGSKAVHVPHVTLYYRQRPGSAMRDAQRVIDDMASMMAVHLAEPDVPQSVRRKSLSLLAFHRGVLLAGNPGKRLAALRQFASAIGHAPLFGENYLRTLRKFGQKCFRPGSVRLPPLRHTLSQSAAQDGEGRGMTNLAVDLVVATTGRKDEPARLLESLTRQTFKNFHVIIVDQNPEGFLADVVARYSGSLSMDVIAMEPRGVSQARNAGLEQARGDIIAFPDDDCWYLPHTLERVVGLFDEFPYMGGLLVSWSEEGQETQPAGLKPVGRTGAFKRGGTHAQFYRGSAIQGIRFDPLIGPGTGLPYGGGEDTDFLLRALEKNVPVNRLSEVLVGHREMDVADTRLAPKLYAYARGRMYLLQKHKFPFYLKAAHVLYPLTRLAVEGPGSWRYRWTMFRGRLSAWLAQARKG